MKHKLKLSFWARMRRTQRTVIVYSALATLLISIVLPLLSPMEAHAVGQSNIAQNAKLKATWSALYLHRCLDNWGWWKAVNGKDIVDFNWSYSDNSKLLPPIGWPDNAGSTDTCEADYTKYAFSNLTSDNGGQILCKMGFKQSKYKDVDYGCLPSDKTWYQSGPDNPDMDQMSINPSDFSNGGKNMALTYNGSAAIDEYAKGKTISFDQSNGGNNPAMDYASTLKVYTAGSIISPTQSGKYTTQVTIWSYDNNKNAYYSEQWYAPAGATVAASILDNNGQPSAAAQAFYSAVGAIPLANYDEAAVRTQCEALFPVPTSSGTVGEYENQARNQKIAACVDGATNKSTGHCESIYLGQDPAGTKDTESSYEKKYGKSVAKELNDACLKGQGVVLTDNGGDGSGNTTDFDICSILDSQGSTPMRWLACSILQAVSGVADALYNMIKDMLYTPVTEIFADTGYQSTIATFRILGMALIFIAGLVMVVAQATGSELVDAYTVRKVLPRLGIAIVGIAIAVPLMKFAITLVNDIGIAAGNFITATTPEQFAAQSVSGSAAAGGATLGILSLITIGVGAVIIGPAVVTYAIAALFALLLAFVTLAVRQLLIVVLVLFAPLAIAASVLPGTDKLWKFWRTTFLTTLMMFPIVMLFLKAGIFMAGIFGAMGKNSSGNAGLYTFMAAIVFIIPYFMLPLAFKMAGGLVGNIAGMVNDRGKGLFDRMRNARSNGIKKNWAAMKEGNRFGDSTRLGKAFNTATRRAALATPRNIGWDPRHWGERLDSTAASEAHSAAGEYAQKSQAFAAIKGDDDKLWGARFTSRDDIERALIQRSSARFGEGKERERAQAVSQIMRAQRETNNATFQRARVRAQAATGTGYINPKTKKFDASMMLDDINSVYGDDRGGAENALAEMRGALANSGQVAGLAGFGTWKDSLDKRYYSSDEYSNEAAHNDILGDTINSVNPGNAVYGKPSSAAALGEAHAQRIKAIASRELSADYTAEDRQAELDAATSAAAGILDAMNSASPQNASEFANNLMNVKIPGSGQPQQGRVVDDYGNVVGQTTAPVVDDYGNVVSTTGALSSSADLTVRQMIEDRMSNTQYAARRKDYSVSTLNEANAIHAQQQAAAQRDGRGGLTTGMGGGLG